VASAGPARGRLAHVRILLTGAAGFIGAATRRQLLDDAHDVIAVDLLLPQAHGAATRADPPDGIHVLDTRTATAWADLLTGVDVVLHLAAMVGAGVTPADLPLYAGHNDLGTAALLAAMHDRGVTRLVQASSMVVYGEGRYTCPEHGPQQPGPRTVGALNAGHFDNPCSVCGGPLDWVLVDEAASLDPRSSYAASKVAQEHYAAAWARQAPGAAISLRYHNVYGAGMPRDTPYSGVAAMFRSSLERDESPVVFEDGRQMRDFVHVTDVARANAAAVGAVAARADGSHAAYNVCSGHPVAIGDVAAFVANGTGRDIAPTITGRYRLGDVRHVVASPERARAELGFDAAIGPDDGLAAFASEPLRP
jgi:dTDP-L-rhamnose 4-epimerase